MAERVARETPQIRLRYAANVTYSRLIYFLLIHCLKLFFCHVLASFCEAQLRMCVEGFFKDECGQKPCATYAVTGH